MTKRRILLVDDEVTVLLTLKAVLEISGFEVDTAASAREGKSRLRTHEYHMVITDMRMESDAAGAEVIQAARTAPYHPAVALLTAFPVDEEDWNGAGPDKILVKATHTRVLLQQIEKLFSSHSAKLSRVAAQASDLKVPAGTSSAPAGSSAVVGKKKQSGSVTEKRVPSRAASERAAVAGKAGD